MAAKVTLRDIAREVGLSTTAVSLVLNDRPCKISKESRRRIKEVARRKRYIPNQIARSLVTRRSQTIGLVVPNIESRFFSSLARRLELGCRERGYVLLITNSDDSADNDAALVRLLANRGVDGIFVVASTDADGEEGVAALPAALEGLPMPLRDGGPPARGPHLRPRCVQQQRPAGTWRAATCSTRAIDASPACSTRPPTPVASVWRATSGRCAERGIEPDPALVFPCAYYIPEAYEVAERLLGTDATAVFAGSDNIALGLLKCLYERGLRVPRDYSVVSYDNSAADVLFEPALTSIEQNVDELAAAALDVMFRRVEEDELGEPEDRILMPRLVIKNSVRAIGEGEKSDALGKHLVNVSDKLKNAEK